MSAERHYEMRVRGGPAGIPVYGPTAESAARAWVQGHGVALGTVVDVRDEDGRVSTFYCVENDVSAVIQVVNEGAC